MKIAKKFNNFAFGLILIMAFMSVGYLALHMTDTGMSLSYCTSSEGIAMCGTSTFEHVSLKGFFSVVPRNILTPMLLLALAFATLLYVQLISIAQYGLNRFYRPPSFSSTAYSSLKPFQELFARGILNTKRF